MIILRKVNKYLYGRILQTRKCAQEKYLLLQELDDVYHDVSAVVAETLIQGADIMALKVLPWFSAKWRFFRHTCRNGTTRPL